MSRPDKNHVTRELLAQLNLSMTFDDAMASWWLNQRDTGGLRLTNEGYQYLVGSNIPHHTMQVDRDLLKKPSTLLVLDRHINGAYYLDTKLHMLVLFDCKQAVMAELYQDMQKFLKFLSDQ
jgi:hypothetical protein